MDSEWWRGFNDAALSRLIELAYQQNLPLQITALRILEARAKLNVAWGQIFPQVQVALGQVNVQRLSKNAPNTGQLDRSFVDYQLGFDVAWELDLWGKYRRGIEAEEATVRASEYDYYGGIVSLTAEAARTYTAIRTFEVLIELAETNARVQEEALKIAEARFQNGATSELDVSQATTLLESTRASIPDLRTGLEQARNALSTLLGQPPGNLDALLVGPKLIPTVTATVAVGVPTDLLRRRPDVRSAEQLAAAQCARVGVAKAELYPTFSLFGTIGFEASTGAGPFLEDVGDSLFYSVGPRIVWPLFNYGRITNNVRIEDARFQQLLVSYQNTVLQAAQEAEDAMAGFLNAQHALTFERQSVEAAKRSVEIALAAYREGEVDFQRVLDAQRALLEQQNRLAETTSSVTTSLIALYKALGGGWKSRQGESAVRERTQAEMRERTSWGDSDLRATRHSDVPGALGRQP